jgi:hypothetical protein
MLNVEPVTNVMLLVECKYAQRQYGTCMINERCDLIKDSHGVQQQDRVHELESMCSEL